MFDWQTINAQLQSDDAARVSGVLTSEECNRLIALYDDDTVFRTRIDMARYSFGVGDYAYFAHPLPAAVAALRRALYDGLLQSANLLAEDIGSGIRYPASYDEFLARCHDAGQTRPTPLMLRYTAGGHNRLHRDLYGDTAFPFQAAIVLNAPGHDFEGGEFMLVENIPRQQARGRVVAPARGEMIVFPVDAWRTRGKRGWIRTSMRHGVSQITRGERWVLGIILHDAT